MRILRAHNSSTPKHLISLPILTQLHQHLRSQFRAVPPSIRTWLFSLRTQLSRMHTSYRLMRAHVAPPNIYHRATPEHPRSQPHLLPPPSRINVARYTRMTVDTVADICMTYSGVDRKRDFESCEVGPVGNKNNNRERGSVPISPPSEDATFSGQT